MVAGEPSTGTTWLTRASRAAGAAATRGGATSTDGAVARPASANSSTSGATIAEVASTASASWRSARFTTNSPVASAFASVSFASPPGRSPAANITVGGRPVSSVKNEKGARLGTPAGDRVLTQAMGRGATRPVSRR